MSAPDGIGLPKPQAAHLPAILQASRLFAEAVPEGHRLLSLIAEQVAELTGDGCAVRLLNEDRSEFRPAVAYHPDAGLREAMRQLMEASSHRSDMGLWRAAIDGRQPFRVGDGDQIPPDASDAQIAFMEKHRVRGLVVAPLIARDVVLGGVLQVRYGDGPGLTSDDEDLLLVLAELAALAIDNARLYEELRTQLESWRALVDNAPDIISRFDRDLRHVYVNPSVESATGMPASAMIGKSNRELGMAGSLVARWDLLLQQVFRDGFERRLEFSFPTPDGERHYQTRLAPEHGPDGTVRTVLTIARDITDQRVADRQREELYRELLERDARLQALVGRMLLERESDVRAEALRSTIPSLSERERDILGRVALGLTNHEIGLELNLSAGTVKNHVARTIEKLGVPDRTAAAVKAVRLGLISLD